jgi:hypothetical protein
VAQRFLAPKLSPDASKSQNSLLNSLIAGKSSGDGRDQHCNASQAVTYVSGRSLGNLLAWSILRE